MNKFVSLALFLTLLLLPACRKPETETSSTPVTPVDTAPSTVIDATTANGPMSPAASGDAAAGAAIFMSRCSGCHGDDGSGNTTMGRQQHITDFSSPSVQSLSDAQLMEVIHEGKGGVAAIAHKSKGLSAAEAKNVIAWIRTLRK